MGVLCTPKDNAMSNHIMKTEKCKIKSINYALCQAVPAHGVNDILRRGITLEVTYSEFDNEPSKVIINGSALVDKKAKHFALSFDDYDAGKFFDSFSSFGKRQVMAKLKKDYVAFRKKHDEIFNGLHCEMKSFTGFISAKYKANLVHSRNLLFEQERAC